MRKERSAMRSCLLVDRIFEEVAQMLFSNYYNSIVKTLDSQAPAEWYFDSRVICAIKKYFKNSYILAR